MAKLHKIQFYLLDYNNDFRTLEKLENYIQYTIRYGLPEHIHITSTDLGEWYDEHPLNYIDCPESEYEKYFKENDQ